MPSAEMFSRTQRTESPEVLKALIAMMKKHGFLTGENFVVASVITNPENFLAALEILEERELLTDRSFGLGTTLTGDNRVGIARETKLDKEVLQRYLSEYDKSLGFFRRYFFRDPKEIAVLREMVKSFNVMYLVLSPYEEVRLYQAFSADLFSAPNDADNSAKNIFIVKKLRKHFVPKYSVIHSYRHHPFFQFLDIQDISNFNSHVNQPLIIELFETLLVLSPEFLTIKVFRQIVALRAEDLNFLKSAIAEMRTREMISAGNVGVLNRMFQDGIYNFLSSFSLLVSSFKLFNQANFTAIVTHHCPDNLRGTLLGFCFAGFKTQINFEDAVRYAHILGHKDVASIFKDQFQNGLVQQHKHRQCLRQAIECCKKYKGSAEGAVKAVVRVLTVNSFDPQINTHTASVHKSASESATRLLGRYGVRINTTERLAAVLLEVSEWLKIVPGVSGEVARRAFERLLLPVTNFVDPESAISNVQLLAMCWLAIHDEERRSPGSTLEESKQRLVDGLYEIQRGGNLVLTDAGALVDNKGAEDNIICEPGAFNKLIEKLFTIHPDAEIQGITNAGAMSKFPIVAQEEARKHLAMLSETMEPEAFMELIKKLGEYGGANHIWPAIEKAVHTNMMDEFGILYRTEACPGGDINHPAYQLVLTGVTDVDLEKVLAIYINKTSDGEKLLHGSFWVLEEPEAVPLQAPAVPAPGVLPSGEYQPPQPTK